MLLRYYATKFLLFVFCAAPVSFIYSQQAVTGINTTAPDTATKKTPDEKEAYFRGGEKAWIAFLSENIDIRSAQKKAPVGKYDIIIQFIVGINGEIRDVEPLSSVGYGMEESVIKAIKKSPKEWVPASIDGKNVAAYRKQPVTLFIEGNSKKKKE